MIRASGPGATATGILYVVAGTLFLACMDAVSKHLVMRLDLFQVIWGRFTFHSLFVLIWLGLSTGGLGFLRSRRPVGQLLRSLTLLGTTGLIFLALITQPLADVIAVMFFAPVLLTLLAGFFLGEAIGLHRLVAVVLGFCGVLLVVRPGFSMNWQMLLPCGAAVLLACYYLMTRAVSSHDNSHTTAFYSTAFGAVALSVAVPFQWQDIGIGELSMLVVLGALGAIGHFFLIAAFARAPASVLSPFLYVQLLAAAVASVVVFQDPLRATTVLGAVFLVGGGLVIWWWEAVLKRRRVAAAGTAEHPARAGESSDRAR